MPAAAVIPPFFRGCGMPVIADILPFFAYFDFMCAPFRTMPVRAKRAMVFGMTISWLNRSESSQTRSLEARVPRKMKTREMIW